MLPTFAFILLAYGLYAFWSVWPRRQVGLYRRRSRRRRRAWLGVAGGVGAGLALLVWVYSPSCQPEQRLKLASFIGVGWADGWAAEKAERRVEPLPLKGQGTGDQPVYTLLHPEAPAGQVAPGKKPATPRPLKKPKLREVSNPQAKVSKANAPSSKKDRVTGKSRPKKKKQYSAPGGQKATSG